MEESLCEWSLEWICIVDIVWSCLRPPTPQTHESDKDFPVSAQKDDKVFLRDPGAKETSNCSCILPKVYSLSLLPTGTSCQDQLSPPSVLYMLKAPRFQLAAAVGATLSESLQPILYQLLCLWPFLIWSLAIVRNPWPTCWGIIYSL